MENCGRNGLSLPLAPTAPPSPAPAKGNVASLRERHWFLEHQFELSKGTRPFWATSLRRRRERLRRLKRDLRNKIKKKVSPMKAG